MKKITFALCALFLISTLTYSRGIRMISNEQIPLPKSESGYNPVLSPTGDYILITGNNLKGLRKYDLATKQLQTLTTDMGAGFDVQISEDGNIIAYRSQQYKDKLRYTSLKTIELKSGKQSVIVKDSRDLEKFTIKNGTVLAVEKGKLKSKRFSGKQLSSIPPISSVKKGQLYITKDRKTELISPAGSGYNYLWTSVSPDGHKMLYYIIEQGKAYISNLDGSNPVSLGVLRAPKWMGNDWVVGMVDYDNGEVLISSKIVAIAADGNNRTDLTDDLVIATNPSGSSDATKIVYNTADGKVFLMNLAIQK